MTPIEIVDKALVIANNRLASAPGFQMFDSIVVQLKYLRAVLTGEEKDRGRLQKIIVGHYAVREFAESDAELSAALTAAQNIASKMAKGLKV